MKETEKQVMCVLLQRLRDQKLITQDICNQARAKILDAWDGPDFFRYAEDEPEERSDGCAQDSR